MLNVAIHAIRTHSGADVFFGRLFEELNAAGVVTCTLTFHHPLFRFAPRLLRASALPEADVIISDAEYAAAFRRGRAKLISTAHQCVFDPVYSQSLPMNKRLWHRFVIRPWTRRSLRESVVTTACSDAVRTLLLREFPDQKIVTVHNGIDCKAFSPGARSLSRPKTKTVLFVGNFIRRKGIDVLPDIARLLGEEYVIRCVSGLRNIAATRAMMSCANIAILPSMNRESLVEEYRRADVVLIPSLHEGFGYIAAEAMACGTPCVTSGANGLGEIVTEDCGRVCADGTSESYAKCIREMCEDQALHEKLSRSARERILNHFSLQRHTKAFLQVLCGS